MENQEHAKHTNHMGGKCNEALFLARQMSMFPKSAFYSEISAIFSNQICKHPSIKSKF